MKKRPQSTQSMQPVLCLRSHYATIVDAHKASEIYQHGDDCPSCARRMADKHAALASTFFAMLSKKQVEPAHAMCHECSEVVEIESGKLAPHHGTSGDGCPLNGADVQIYLHPLVAECLFDLSARLVFGGSR